MDPDQGHKDFLKIYGFFFAEEEFSNYFSYFLFNLFLCNNLIKHSASRNNDIFDNFSFFNSSDLSFGAIFFYQFMVDLFFRVCCQDSINFFNLPLPLRPSAQLKPTSSLFVLPDHELGLL